MNPENLRWFFLHSKQTETEKIWSVSGKKRKMLFIV
jgi:hypothetical protein